MDAQFCSDSWKKMCGRVRSKPHPSCTRRAMAYKKGLKGTGSPYKVTTMLLTAPPFCFYHISKLLP